MIREVADEKGLDEDRINNDSYGLPEVTEIIGRLEWITAIPISCCILQR